MAEGGGLLNRYRGKPLSWVRIPSPPPASSLRTLDLPPVAATAEPVRHRLGPGKSASEPLDAIHALRVRPHMGRDREPAVGRLGVR